MLLEAQVEETNCEIKVLQKNADYIWKTRTSKYKNISESKLFPPSPNPC